MPFYAVAVGKTPGIFLTWEECKQSVIGCKGAIFKKFDERKDAEKFIAEKSATPATIEADYYVYTDGACANNGAPNAIAGMGIYFGDNDPRNVSQRISGKQSNNTAELGAILHLCDMIKGDTQHKICVVSDSIYAIRCVTDYGKKHAEQNWKKEIPNKELVRKAYEAYKDLTHIKFLYVKAHTGGDDKHSLGNAEADRLANLSVGIV